MAKKDKSKGKKHKGEKKESTAEKEARGEAVPKSKSKGKKKQKATGKGDSGGDRQQVVTSGAGSRMPFPLEVRIRAAREVVEGGLSAAVVSRALNIPYTTVCGWAQRYSTLGVDGLRSAPRGPEPRPPDAEDPRREAVLGLHQENPDYGARRIEQVLARFAGLGVSATEVRRILADAGVARQQATPRDRERPPRRFERAEPNQLWQSDIFTFLLRRHERLYMAAFMDDHSRYLVSYALGHHQKASLVLEALSRGVADCGAPREMLTDQGRQYAAWRGETAFAQELRRLGVAHVKSRPQHPETLGKIERFWKTLWDELLSRTVFADFADCERRIRLYIKHYNFLRPHQALSGLVPADRFFRAAPHVRDAIEKNVEKNALLLAQEQPPQKPFYLVGRLGDQDLSIATGTQGLQVQLGGTEQTIRLPKESDDEPAEIPARLRGPLVAEDAPSATPDQGQPPPDETTVAEPSPAMEVDVSARWIGDEQPDVDDDNTASDDAVVPRDPCVQLSERDWHLLAELAAALDEVDTDDARQFDPDEGWRGRATVWDRKLTGAQHVGVAGEARSEDIADDEEQDAGPWTVREEAKNDASWSPPVRDRAAGAQRRDDGDRRGNGSRALSRADADDRPPRGAGAPRGVSAWPAGPAARAAELAEERGAPRAREPEAPRGHGAYAAGPHDGGRPPQGPHPRVGGGPLPQEHIALDEDDA
jgi:transposase InsO family protein